MKILIISRGGFLHTFTYIDYFLEKGCTIYYYALSPIEKELFEKYKSKIFIKSTLKKDIKSNSLFKKLVLIKPYLALRSFVNKIKPDIIHIHFLTSGGLSSFFFKHPNTFITVHGSDILVRNNFYWRIIQRKILKKVNFITVVSKQIENEVLKLGIPRSKIIFLPVGINTSVFSNSNLLQKDLTTLKIISTRRLEKIYNYETVIDALSILKKKNIPFYYTIVGYGIEEEFLKKVVNDHSLSEHISFVGQKTIEEIKELFRDKWVYVSASLSDGTSLSLLEAMSSGLYPVVSNITANQYWIENGEGLMFSTKSPEDLAQKLIYVWQNKDTCMKKVSINVDIVSKDGDLIKNMSKLSQIYSECLA